jgi:hypothetical protein
VPDLLDPSLVEMLAEMSRDLLARRRAYTNRVFTRRLTHERAERRLVIVQAIIDNLTAQLSPAQLQAIAQAKEKRERLKAQRRKPATKGTALQGVG